MYDTYALFHNSHHLAYRRPFGAVRCGREITLRLQTADVVGSAILFVEERFARREMTMRTVGDEMGRKLFEARFAAPHAPGTLAYYFAASGPGGTRYYGNNPGRNGGLGEATVELPPPYLVSVYPGNRPLPAWFTEALACDVFLDAVPEAAAPIAVLTCRKATSFPRPERTTLDIKGKNGIPTLRRHLHRGKLAALTAELPGLKRRGVGLLLLSPVFQSPPGLGPGASDFLRLEAQLGSSSSFRELCSSAAEMGISVIISAEFNFAAADSIYFNKEGRYASLGAHQSKASLYSSWFRFTHYPDGYETWQGNELAPAVNVSDPSFQEFVVFGAGSVLRVWQQMGIRGWRLLNAGDLTPSFTADFSAILRREYSNSVLIGDEKKRPGRNEVLRTGIFDGAIPSPLQRLVLDFITGRDAAETLRDLAHLFEMLPPEVIYGSVNTFDEETTGGLLFSGGASEAKEWTDTAVKRLRMLLLLQMAMPGTPCFDYGDPVWTEKQDAEERAPDRKDPTPEWVRNLVALREYYDVLRTGACIPLHVRENVFCCMRLIEGSTDVFGQKKSDNAAVVVVNRDETSEASVSIDVGRWCAGEMVDPLDDYRRVPLRSGQLELSLQPLEARLLLRDRWGSNHRAVRKSGILVHPTSLPSRYGIGDLGSGARKLVDFLVNAGQKLWQILPLNPPGCANSPYQCLSAFAGNHLLIDPEQLAGRGRRVLPEAGLPPFPKGRVDFEEAAALKEEILRRAFAAFPTRTADFAGFCLANRDWLEDYCLFMALKDHFEGRPWNRWEEGAARRRPEVLEHYRRLLSEDVEYHRFLQFTFFRQWRRLKQYANARGIQIVGDLPIYVSHDSSDVWTQPELFELDDDGNPTKIAGVPPDAFTETGQLWGNPIYRWQEMQKEGFRWWKRRLRHLSQMVDLIRIDHFRGFEAYWEVPAGEETAVNGRWVKGPGEKLFAAVKKELGSLPIIAEDLGFITPEVLDLKTRFGLPGMTIMQFSMEDDEFTLPLAKKNTVLYTGTHDNDTILGWIKTNQSLEFTGREGEKNACWRMIEMAMRSDAEMVVIPLQDILCLGSEARMNTPGTVEGNWQWRFGAEDLNQKTAERLRLLTESYHR